jgi:hypothetical protein
LALLLFELIERFPELSLVSKRLREADEGFADDRQGKRRAGEGKGKEMEKQMEQKRKRK